MLLSAITAFSLGLAQVVSTINGAGLIGTLKNEVLRGVVLSANSGALGR
jgi:hypothetical protein